MRSERKWERAWIYYSTIVLDWGEDEETRLGEAEGRPGKKLPYVFPDLVECMDQVGVDFGLVFPFIHLAVDSSHQKIILTYFVNHKLPMFAKPRFEKHNKWLLQTQTYEMKKGRSTSLFQRLN